MKRTLLVSLTLALTLITAVSSGATQAVPDTMRKSGLSVSEEQTLRDEISRLSRATTVSETALTAIAEALLLEAGDAVQLSKILQKIRERAEQIAILELELARLASASNTADAAMISQVQSAIQSGDFELAATNLESAISIQKNRGLIDRLRLPTMQMLRGVLAIQQNKEDDAVSFLTAALDAYLLIVPDIDRERQPRLWADTQLLIGNTAVMLVATDDHRHLGIAAIAYSEALKVLRYEESPDDWVSALRKLAELMLIMEGPSENSLKSTLLIADQVLGQVDCTVAPKDCGWAHYQRAKSMAGMFDRRIGSFQPVEILDEFTIALSLLDRETQGRIWSESKAVQGAFLIAENRPDEAADTIFEAAQRFEEIGDETEARRLRSVARELKQILSTDR